jgi:hypothetical protein
VEREDLAVTSESVAIAEVRLAGTNWIPGLSLVTSGGRPAARRGALPGPVGY